ncbi:hypothetical protein AGMMS49545_01260 [Betaproteobacteria bacterium]|nr:hypothetical protein AGMMS49545_01260 [Betaproteobacteria bacterium]
MPLPFFAGLAVGVIALRLYQNERLRAEIKDAGAKLRRSGVRAEDKLRQAAVSGLDTLAESSGRLRDRLDATPDPVVETKVTTAKATPKKAAATAPKPAPKTSRAKKTEGGA